MLTKQKAECIKRELLIRGGIAYDRLIMRSIRMNHTRTNIIMRFGDPRTWPTPIYR